MSGDSTAEVPPAVDPVAVLVEIRDLIAAGPKPEPLLLPCAQAASLVSLGESTFRKAVVMQDAPQPVQTPGGARWKVAELKKWVEQLKVRKRRRKARRHAGEPAV
jgi:predicted DNA-binding transcriptional regulator AlpA